MDLFRLTDAPGVIIATARFVETATRLELDGATFLALEAR
jgi:hypothetical protein